MTHSSGSVDLPRFKATAKTEAKTEAKAETKAEIKAEATQVEASAIAPGKPTGYSFARMTVPAQPNRKVAGPSVQAYPLPKEASQLPMLPRKKRAVLSSHRHDANPALAIKVLQDIQESVEGWHQTLRQTLLDIQAIYLEGPIVEGWLETVQPQMGSSTESASILRHADLQELSGYVDRLCQEPAVDKAILPGQEPQYRLCSLDADGQLQCQICPPDQLPFVSMAIARHQKLRQHLNQKQYLDAKLKRAVEVLTQVREELGITPKSEAAQGDEGTS